MFNDEVTVAVPLTDSDALSTMISKSATFRALTCADIIVEMIKQTALPLDGPLTSPYHKYDRPLLSTLALVCRAFNGPATKALWSRLDSFLPVLNVLSAFDSSSPVTNPTYLICGDVSPYEFSRFRELGSFIRAVVPSPGCVCESDQIKPSVWFYLAQISEGRSLFPHLQDLHWFIEESSNTALLLVVPSSLQRLSICYGGCSTGSQEWRFSQSMLFRSVFKAAPSLTQLAIHDTDDALFPSCLSNISVLRNLRTVFLEQDGCVSLSVLHTLSSVESLEELSIGVDSIDGIDFVGFPAVKKLNVVSTPPLGPSSRVFHMHAFSSPHLRELKFYDRSDEADADNLLTTCTTIVGRFPSMADLSLTLSSPFRVRDGGASLETALAPLFPLPMVKFSLDIECSLAAPLSGVFFTALAKSWPYLLELSVVTIQHGVGGPSSSPITAHTLLALARGCPQLQTLRLPSMTCVHPGETRGYTVLQHPLRTLAVDTLFGVRDRAAVVGDDEYVECALLLDKLFPELDTRSSPISGVLLTNAWKRVLSSVQLCQLGRSNRPS